MSDEFNITQEVDESSVTPSVDEEESTVQADESKSSEIEIVTEPKEDSFVDAQVVVEVEVDEETEEDAQDDVNEDRKNNLQSPEEFTDYLSPTLLNIKSITVDEITSYSEEEEELDEDAVEMYSSTFSDIKEGEIVPGNVVGLTDREVLVDVGFKSEGIISRTEFDEIPNIGDEIEVFIHNFEDRRGRFILSKEKADFVRHWDHLKECYETGEIITGSIIRRIKGGLVVDLGPIFAFLPGSQIDVRPVVDFDDYLDKEFEFKIVKLNELRKNVVLSRKELLESDIREKRQEIFSQLEVGMVLEGTVKNITDFGAFIDLGGIDGLLHITDITWGRINHPSEVLTPGQTLNVKVIDFDGEKLRVSLGLKQLQPEPWKDAEQKYPVTSVVEGKVVNMMNYGVFIELEEGVEGLLHVSEMSWTRHIKHPGELFKLGDKVESKILSIDANDKKISLGIKQLQPNPWDDIETKYAEGTIHEGKIQNLTQFGAFVELEEGVDGLVHISDLSWTKNVRHPKDIVNKGQEIKVKILEVNSENRRLSLGIKQVMDNPWPGIIELYPSGKTISGEVIRALDKGIIFKLEDDLEGIIPLNKFPKNDRWKKKKQFTPEMKVDGLVVQEVDEQSKKIILMMDWDEETEGESDTKQEVQIENEPTSDKLEIPEEVLQNISDSEENTQESEES